MKEKTPMAKVEAPAPLKMSAKNKRINTVIEAAKAALDKEGVNYLLTAIHYEPNDPTGGAMHIEHNATAKDLILTLQTVVKDTTTLTAIGMWVGQSLAEANKQAAARKKSPTNLTSPKKKRK